MFYFVLRLESPARAPRGAPTPNFPALDPGGGGHFVIARPTLHGGPAMANDDHPETHSPNTTRACSAQGSAISDEVIGARGYRTITDCRELRPAGLRPRSSAGPRAC